jgi:hypothetical protein
MNPIVYLIQANLFCSFSTVFIFEKRRSRILAEDTWLSPQLRRLPFCFYSLIWCVRGS